MRAHIVCKWKLRMEKKRSLWRRARVDALHWTFENYSFTHPHSITPSHSVSFKRNLFNVWHVWRPQYCARSPQHFIPVVDLLQHCALSIHWVSARIISWKLSIHIRIQTLLRKFDTPTAWDPHAAGFCDKMNVQINFHLRIRKWATDTPAGMAYAVCISQTQ